MLTVKDLKEKIKDLPDNTIIALKIGNSYRYREVVAESINIDNRFLYKNPDSPLYFSHSLKKEKDYYRGPGPRDKFQNHGEVVIIGHE